MQFQIVHRIVGRTRIRIAGLRTVEGKADLVEKTLADQPGVLRVRLNIWCESAVIETDPACADAAEAVLDLLTETHYLGNAGQDPSSKRRSAAVRLIRAPFGVERVPHPMVVSTAALVLCLFEGQVTSAISV